MDDASNPADVEIPALDCMSKSTDDDITTLDCMSNHVDDLNKTLEKSKLGRHNMHCRVYVNACTLRFKLKFDVKF